MKNFFIRLNNDYFHIDRPFLLLCFRFCLYILLFVIAYYAIVNVISFSIIFLCSIVKLYYLYIILLLINVAVIFVKDDFYIKMLILFLNFLAFFILFVINYKYMYFDVYHNIKLIVEHFNFYIFTLDVTYDSISLLLIDLTFILGFVSYVFCFSEKNYKVMSVLITLVLFFLVLAFSTFNLLVFYIAFESILIPMFLMIGIFGSRERKLTAAFRLFFYTLFGSFFFLGFLIYIYYVWGTFDLIILKYLVLYQPLFVQKVCWFCMFIALAIKIPIYPFHTWLPEAHAEAPTVGSILLAGILLKLGPYGFLRFANVLFPMGFLYFKPLIYLLCLLSIYYTAIIAIRQLDIKKIVAYSSISHMAFTILGLWSLTLEGITGCILLLLAHGFVSGALFMLVGYIYQRYKTRIILYYGGLAQINPLMAFLFFFALLGNISFPITLNFISEILIMLSLLHLNLYVLILVVFSGVFILSYNLYLFNRLFFGLFSKFYVYYTPDLLNKEVMMLIILLFPVFLFGITSVPLTHFTENAVMSYLYDVSLLPIDELLKQQNHDVLYPHVGFVNK